jgi:4-methyl-5(b-hydroxyethyl)-thiazole monophosphate biosynthesis
MPKSVIVLLANGFEEIEALTPVDVFRRAGLNVVTAAVGTGENGPVAIGSHGVPVVADCLVEEVVAEDAELVFFPGGLPGATNLAASKDALAIAKEIYDRGGWVAAICAAPLALSAAGLLCDMDFTCYPGIQEKITEGDYTGARVEVCEHIVTGCGPGAALEMSFKLLECLGMADDAGKIAAGMQCQ